MGSPEQLTGPTRGAAPAHWRGGWAALLATVGARAVLSALAGLLLVALLPPAFGWHSTVVMTGSMQPKLHPGDVVVSRPIASEALRPGQVLLVADPDHPGRLRLHRLAALRPDGRLTLRGDANRADDSTPVARTAVKGVGSLHAPYVGLPFLWARDGEYGSLLLAGAGLAVLLAAAFAYRPDGANDHTDSTAAPPTPRRRIRLRHRPRLVRLGAALAVAVALGITWAAPARGAAGFTAAATNAADTWSAIPYFTCAAAVTAADPYLYYRLADTGTSAADSSGNNRTGTYQGIVTKGVAGACARDTATAVTLDGATGWISTPTSVANPTAFTEEIWFRTTTTRGGELLGFGNTQLGLPTSYDRHLFMNNAGRIVFGVYPGSVKTIVSPAAYNDGAWHLVDATLSPTAGMVLYVDGQQVAADPTTVAAQNYTGYWRVGYNTLANWGTNTPTSYFFAGTIAQAAVYSGALTASQVAGHYAAAK